MSEVTMPRLSDTMQEGTIARWLKKPGEEIKKGDVLAEIETDKATMDLEAFDAGVLEQILVPEGETVPIGQAVATLGTGTGAQQPAQPAQPEQPAADRPFPLPDEHFQRCRRRLRGGSMGARRKNARTAPMQRDAKQRCESSAETRLHSRSSNV